MTIHLIKLSVGPDSLADLEDWQQRRWKEQKRKGEKPELIHVTRQTPKRAEELLAGGSIYWIINGFVCGRQKLLELRPTTKNGVPHCGLVYDREMIRVAPRPHRPFQGWRYLNPRDAPRDLAKGEIDENMPEEMRRELAKLGLL